MNENIFGLLVMGFLQQFYKPLRVYTSDHEPSNPICEYDSNGKIIAVTETYIPLNGKLITTVLWEGKDKNHIGAEFYTDIEEIKADELTTARNLAIEINETYDKWLEKNNAE